MDQLILIKETNGNSTVSARDLHSYLNATERFSAWIDRQFQYGFVENLDYVGCKEFNTLANQELTDYALTIDTAKEISMLQKSEKGQQARRYFIEVEKKSKLKELPSVKELALMVIKSEEERERLEIQNKLQDEQLKLSAPKVNYYDTVLTSVSTYTTTQIAKELGMSAITLNKILKDNNIQYSQSGQWVLYSKHQNKGFTKTTTHSFTDGDGKTRTTMLTVWTEAGRKAIHSLINKINNG